MRAGLTEAPTVSWDECSRETWDGLLAAAGRSPLEQSWAYGDALARSRVRRGVFSQEGQSVAMVQVFEHRILSRLRLAQVLRGPVWLAGAPDREILSSIKREYRLRSGSLLVWTPELSDGTESEALMRAAGLRRMATGHSSAWIDLTKPADDLRRAMHGKWRNALRAAESSELAIDATSDFATVEWLAARYDAHRKRARYAGPSAAFVLAMIQARPSFLVLRAHAQSDPVAGILFIRHGAAATYHVGWTGDQGRRLNAHNLLLWQGMIALKDLGVSWLDLGGINAAAPGVARFKMGAGGRFYTLTGTYI